ncbi:MAG: DUF4954 family protein, partial [Planctomycetota bacterium]
MTADHAFRPLTDGEMEALEANGCVADDWSHMRVADGFSPESVRRCTFSGDVQLGAFREPVALCGVPVPSGVYDSHLHNVAVSDNSLVRRVDLLANYTVGPGAVLSNCGAVTVGGETAFGNGVEVVLLNEGGGREVRIFERLSAQLAYLAACYRHRPALVEAIARMAADYAAGKRAEHGQIGPGSIVRNCGTVQNVAIGAAATVSGARRLANGTIASNAQAPTTVGEGVTATDFIIGTGSTVDGGATLARCFIGQGCRIGSQFSAEHCAFFANCEAYHGEAVSVLAGPYTVSHHKSTLLIAGLFSFFNAGSGTNQSNHMYKLGPVHQGVLERGCKTGSFSYLLWPTRVGPFSVVLGKHRGSFDASDLPFSSVDEHNGRSVIFPAVNLFAVGTKRDGAKWPSRDRRTDPDKLDLIRFEVFSPFTVGRILRGAAALSEIYETTPRSQDDVLGNGIWIKRVLCRSARKHYDLAVTAYLGGMLVSRLEGERDTAAALARPAGNAGGGDWVDVLGLLAPRQEVEALCDDVESGEVADLAALEQRLRSLHESYADYEWAWAQDAWRAVAGKTPSEMTADELAEAVAQ